MRRLANRRGATFAEMMIAIAIFSGVSIFVMSVVLLAARNSNRSLAAIPAETNTYRAMDRIRQEILPAKLTTVKTQDEGRELLFTNPVLGQDSILDYNAATKQLTFKPDITEDESVNFGSFQECEFQTAFFGRNINVRLVASSKDSRNGQVPLTHQEWITVRN